MVAPTREKRYYRRLNNIITSHGKSEVKKFMAEKSNVCAVELEHISKTFGTLRANDDISIQLRYGEIHALLGENGAGKSTLMNILFGLIKPDSGSIRVNGKPVTIRNPNDATALGIGMVHQHFHQVECFTVLQNIILGLEDVRHGVLDTEASRKKVLALSEKYGLNIDPDAKVADVTVGMQQRIEILKMLYRNSDVLIFDEPTALLTPQEIEDLLKLMKDLAANGKCILFITHKLNEIRAVADRCSILRKGKYIATLDVANVTEEELSECMVGRKVALTVEKSPAHTGEVILKAENLCVRSKTGGKRAVNGVSFDVRAGEIVTLAGIDGNGQSELIYALAGMMKTESGTVTLGGKPITDLGARERTKAGLAHIPENRLKYGLVGDCTLEENFILQSYYTPEFQSHGFLRFKEIRAFAEREIAEYDIRAGEGALSAAGRLSGGNQQKAVIARELAREPSLVIAAQPSRGLDVGAIEFIHRRLLEMRDSGHAVLLMSFDLKEVMGLSDRILVMFEGKIVASCTPDETTVQELGLYMSGARKQNA